MPIYKEKRFFSFSAEQLFTLVSDVEKYPAFLPWCKEVVLLESRDDTLLVGITSGLGVITETFITRDTLYYPSRIDIELVEGPFKHLNSHWIFHQDEESQGCHVAFFIDFEFRSHFLSKLASSLFHEVNRQMVNAFEKRAQRLYAAP